MAKKIHLLAFLLFIISLKAQVVTTFAGSAQGYIDGSNATAQFNVPLGLAADSNGAIYVADYYNHKIRKITPNGVVSTFAGSTQGYADGEASVAQFNHPNYIAIDSNNNLFVSDLVNKKIRKITPSGTVSTFAGSSTGTADGDVSVAQFMGPAGLAFDSQGNLFVCDYGAVRKINTNNMVTTFAGSNIIGFSDGSATTAQFNNPLGMAIDSNNIIYVVDNINNRIRKVTTDGVVSTLAGSTAGYNDGTGDLAKFDGPVGIAIDFSGALFISDTSNNKIRKIDNNGNVSTFAGSTFGYTDGYGTEAQFKYPQGLCIDSNANLYIGDVYNYKIRKINQTLYSNEHDFQNEIILYPVPATDFLKIEFKGTLKANSTIDITDSTGKKIYCNTINSIKMIIDTSNYSQGIYLLSFFDGSEKVIKKIIKK